MKPTVEKLPYTCGRCGLRAIARLTSGSHELLCFPCLTDAIDSGELEEEDPEDGDDVDNDHWGI